jgi:hypothetical protein
MSPRGDEEMSMSDAVAARTFDVTGVAQKLLTASGVIWFIPAFVGQWIFAIYVAGQYVGPALAGDVSGWNDIMPTGLIAGDLAGNIALGAHLFMAFVITIGGTLQLVPQIRAHAPTFHRWNGRLYIAVAFLTSIAALYMVWTRDLIGGFISDISISIDAVLIMTFAAMALRNAMARRFDAHQRWALRTFMVVSAVWFMRVMYSFLGILAQGRPPGVGDNMDGPTDVAVGFASYLLPLAVLELYFWAKRSDGALPKVAISVLVIAAAGATAVGVFGATLGMWLPRLTS